MIYFTTFHTEIGELAVFAESDAIIRIIRGENEIEVLDQMMEHYPDPIEAGLIQQDNLPLLKKAKQQIEEYLRGERKEFALPMKLGGAPFQRQVWKELQDIPYGEAIDYSELARRAGNEKAVRAAGSGCGANPLPLVIPCHRVKQKSGQLGGFGWGLDVKQKLLELESAA